MASEHLQFDDLNKYLLLKNGNYLYKVPFRDGFAVLKVYYGSRSTFRYVAGTVSNYLSGQTSFMPRARMKNERKCLEIWRKYGFRVFDTYDIAVEGLPENGYMMLEYLPALRFVQYFADKSVSLDDKLATYRRFLPVWGRRHQLAIENNEPKLVHENGDMKHVMIVGDEFLFFDFEMHFRSRSKKRVEEFVSREILAYLKSLGKTVGEDFPVFLKETIAKYPRRRYLENAYDVMFRHPNPANRAARWIDRHTNKRANKPFSKYNVALQIKQLLE